MKSSSVVIVGRQRKCAVAKSYQQKRLTQTEESHVCLTAECGKRVQVRVIMDSVAAGHVVPGCMFPHVKLEQTNSTTEVCGSEWTNQRHWRQRRFHSRQMNGVHRSQERDHGQTFHLNAESRPSWKHCGAVTRKTVAQ